MTLYKPPDVRSKITPPSLDPPTEVVPKRLPDASISNRPRGAPPSVQFTSLQKLRRTVCFQVFAASLLHQPALIEAAGGRSAEKISRRVHQKGAGLSRA